jgi:hypothetical protein
VSGPGEDSALRGLFASRLRLERRCEALLCALGGHGAQPAAIGGVHLNPLGLFMTVL